MNKRTFLFTCLILIALALPGQLRRDRLFKVDPVSAFFKEIRVSVENRLKGDIFWYLAPHGHHQTSLKDLQKLFGAGARAGLRWYLLTDYSPHGFYIHGGASYRYTWVHFMTPTLEIDRRVGFHSPGLNAWAGYQVIKGPRNRRMFVGGVGAGMEYFFNFPQNIRREEGIRTNWYEFPSNGPLSFLSGLRLYLTVEVGFAFLQKRLHW